METQSPDSREAVFAYHLHRLALSSSALRERGLPRALARDIRQGRRDLSEQDILDLAVRLGIHPGMLQQPLSPFQRRDWDFYRVSARHPRAAWLNVIATTAPSGLSLRSVADAAQVDPGDLSRVLGGIRQRPVLTWSMAEPIGRLLTPVADPASFLDGLPPHPAL